MANKDKKDQLAVALLAMAGTAGVIFLVAIGFYIGQFRGTDLSRDPTRWAEFGDYLGGTVSPIMALFALLALLYTIHLQNRELSSSTEQLKRSAKALNDQNEYIRRQNAESTFFSLLSLYQTAVSEVKYVTLPVRARVNPSKYEGTVISGRTALAEQIGRFSDAMNASDFEEMSETESDVKFIKASYENNFLSRENGIDSYNKVVLNVLRCLRDIDDENLREKLSGIFYSCLSRYEKTNFLYLYICKASDAKDRSFESECLLRCVSEEDLEYDFLKSVYTRFLMKSL